MRLRRERIFLGEQGSLFLRDGHRGHSIRQRYKETVSEPYSLKARGSSHPVRPDEPFCCKDGLMR